MSAVSKRDGTRTFGQGGRLTEQISRESAEQSGSYAGRHASTPRKAARWARKAAPAAAIAATLAAGVAAYGLTSSAKPDATKLTAALAVPIGPGAVTHAGTGNAGSTDAARVLAAARAASNHARSASHPSARPAAKRRAPAATARRRPAATVSRKPAAAPSHSAAPAAPAGVSCSTASGLLPMNVTAIVSFLIGHGYSHNAAAGIAGNIYQESKGNPESVGMGGGGLIGWTPLPTGFVTGNPAADLQTQLSALLTFNQGWAAYLPALNSAATPADAAAIYVTDFERAGVPAASTREASAQAVAAACGF